MESNIESILPQRENLPVKDQSKNMLLTKFMNNTILAHPHFNDNDIQINRNKNQQIISESIDATMASYFRGELNDMSIHDESQFQGVNHMKSLISSISQFQLISDKFESKI